MIQNVLYGELLLVYGYCLEVRDRLCVEEHARSLIQVITECDIGEAYNIGGNHERVNLEVS